jgi:hypothetical protein
MSIWLKKQQMNPTTRKWFTGQRSKLRQQRLKARQQPKKNNSSQQEITL